MNRFVLAVVTALAAAGVAPAQVTEEDLANDATSVGDVLTNGMGRDLQRYSPLETLNKTNVKKLVRHGPSASAARSSAGRRPSRSSMTA